MKYNNPVIPGMNPDPSCCYANGKYYLVTSSFEFFPAMPIYESENLINWKQIGHVITDEKDLDLTDRKSSLGIYAPTIRFHDGVFYVITTDVLGRGNLIMTSTNIYEGFDKQILIEHEGIDPSLYFEDDKVYFCATSYINGKDCIVMNEIDVTTGKKLTEDFILSYGIESRNVEGPHIYKFDDYYYILASEGGTEYGHLITCLRSKEIYGPYEAHPDKVVVTKRNDMETIQAVGHGDIVQLDNEYYLIHLGIRKHPRTLLHNLGRETFLTPLVFKDGWPYLRDDTVTLEVETNISFTKQDFDFKDEFNAELKNNYLSVRKHYRNFTEISNDGLLIKGNNESISDYHPTYLGIVQPTKDIEVSTEVQVETSFNGNAGLSVYYNTSYHYDLYINEEGRVCLDATVHNLTSRVNCVNKSSEVLKITSNDDYYEFYNGETYIGKLSTAGMATEQTMEMTFTGTTIGMYSYKDNAIFKYFKLENK